MDVVFTAHPSGLKFPDDAKGIKRPISVAIGDKDMAVGEKGRKEMERVLGETSGLKSEVKLYKGATHGFAIRAEFGPQHVDQAKEAEEQAVKWFVERFAEVRL